MLSYLTISFVPRSLSGCLTGYSLTIQTFPFHVSNHIVNFHQSWFGRTPRVDLLSGWSQDKGTYSKGQTVTSVALQLCVDSEWQLNASYKLIMLTTSILISHCTPFHIKKVLCQGYCRVICFHIYEFKLLVLLLFFNFTKRTQCRDVCIIRYRYCPW